ncbi:MAG: C10 family peptidase, partial [Muribaculaceae bacterium]|nr:C10 family peptidase [Muribaculaceae bacterium]
MKKFLLAAIVGMAVTSPAAAEVLTPAQALQRAIPSVTRSGRMAAPAMTASPAMTLNASDGIAAIYMFDTPDGTAIVSADDIALPLLGFTDAASGAATMPDNMKAWLDFYASEIAAARAAGAKAAQVELVRPFREPISPICYTTWNQDYPYNMLCPKDRQTGRATYTGCAATAMAQVLATYRYPTKLSGGTFTYTPEGQNTISLNFDNITLDWDNMLDSYPSSDRGTTEAQRTAVATLMYALGVAAQMNYGITASGASAPLMGMGLLRNFGLDESLQYVFREWYTLYDWEDLIYSTLAGGHASYYDGISSEGAGHAFVVDGYRDNGYFHLNWGWGGISDGYFLLSALDPFQQGIGGSHSGYNNDQATFLNIKPREEGSVAPLTFMTQHQFGLPSTVRRGSSFDLSIPSANGGIFNFSFGSTNGAKFVLRFTPANGGKARYSYATWSIQDLPLLAGYGAISFPYPSSISAGDYLVEPMVMSTDGTAYPIHRPAGFMPFIATVSSASIAFHQVNSDNTDIAVTDMATLTDGNYAGAISLVDATVTNGSSSAIYRNVVGGALLSVNPDGSLSLARRLGAGALVLDPKAYTKLTLQCAIPADVQPGDYKFAVIDAADKVISDGIDFNVQANPGAPLLG